MLSRELSACSRSRARRPNPEFTAIIQRPGPAAGPQQWLDAFRPFGPTGLKYAGALPIADLAFLRAFEDQLVAAGTIRPRPRPRDLA